MPKDKAWYGRWTDDSGQRRAQKLATTAARAKARARQIDRAVKAGYLGTHPDEPMRRSLASMLVEYQGKLERSAKPKHVGTVIGALRRCFNAVKATRVGEVTANALEGYLDKRAAGGAAPNTVGHHRGYIKSFFKWAYESDRIPHNPAKGLETRTGPKRRRRQANNREEIAAIVAAADAGPHEYERPSVRLGYMAGLRQGEILGLRWGDIEIKTCDDCRGTGTIDGRPCQQCGGLGASGEYKITEDRQKGKKDTVNPMHPELVEYLTNYRKETAAQYGSIGDLDTIVRAAPASARALSEHRKQLVARAGLKYKNLKGELCDWHSMRHSFVTLLGVNPQMDINTKRLLARHADVKTTQGYDHGDIRRQRAGLTQLRVVGQIPPLPIPPAPAAGQSSNQPKVVHLPTRKAQGGEE
jgi:integrase